MARRYRNSRPRVVSQSPRARSTYRGTRMISNPNVLKTETYNSAMAISSEYRSRLNAIESTGQARKLALKKVLNRSI